MTIHWGALAGVFGVSLGATLAVVVLVTLAQVGLSARVPGASLRLSRPSGTALAAACLTGAAAIVLVGLWAIVVR